MELFKGAWFIFQFLLFEKSEGVFPIWPSVHHLQERVCRISP